MSRSVYGRHLPGWTTKFEQTPGSANCANSHALMFIHYVWQYFLGLSRRP